VADPPPPFAPPPNSYYPHAALTWRRSVDVSVHERLGDGPEEREHQDHQEKEAAPPRPAHGGRIGVGDQKPYRPKPGDDVYTEETRFLKETKAVTREWVPLDDPHRKLGDGQY
jgi:hypothetical protein